MPELQKPGRDRAARIAGFQHFDFDRYERHNAHCISAIGSLRSNRVAFIPDGSTQLYQGAVRLA